MIQFNHRDYVELLLHGARIHSHVLAVLLWRPRREMERDRTQDEYEIHFVGWLACTKANIFLLSMLPDLLLHRHTKRNCNFEKKKINKNCILCVS